jgi:amidase
MLQLLGSDGVLALPSAPGPAPPCGLPAAQQDDWRRRLISLTCMAGLAGLPQVALPAGSVDGRPVGLSLIGPPGSDESLLELAVRLAGVLGLGR